MRFIISVVFTQLAKKTHPCFTYAKMTCLELWFQFILEGQMNLIVNCSWVMQLWFLNLSMVFEGPKKTVCLLSKHWYTNSTLQFYWTHNVRLELASVKMCIDCKDCDQEWKKLNLKLHFFKLSKDNAKMRFLPRNRCPMLDFHWWRCLVRSHPRKCHLFWPSNNLSWIWLARGSHWSDCLR